MGKSLLLVNTPDSCSECELSKILNHPTATSYVFNCIHRKCFTTQKEFHTRVLKSCPLRDTSELLSDLEMMCNADMTDYDCAVNDIYEEEYKEIYKALGGKLWNS